MIASWEQPAADDLSKLSAASANSSRICIRFNSYARFICKFQSERRIQAAYEIYFLAVSSAFRQTFTFEMPECLHFGRRAHRIQELSAAQSGLSGWSVSKYSHQQTTAQNTGIVCRGGAVVYVSATLRRLMGWGVRVCCTECCSYIKVPTLDSGFQVVLYSYRTCGTLWYK